MRFTATLLAVLAISAPAAAQDIYVANDSGVTVFDGSTGEDLGAFVLSGSGGLSRVTGVVGGADGLLYVASADTDTVSRFDGASGNFIDDFLTNAEGLRSPMGLTVGPNGNIFVANRFLDSVIEADPDTGAVVAEFVGTTAVPIITVEDIAFDASGRLYVASANTNTVVRIDIDTGLAEEFVPASAGLDYPHGLAFDVAGDLFVSSHFGNEVLRFDGNGNLIESFAAVTAPVGLVFDAADNLSVVSFGTGTIQRFDPAGAPLSSLTTTSTASYLTLVDLPRITSLARSPTTVTGGCQNSTLTVTLDRAAPAGGIFVSLTSGNAAVSVPSAVFVAGGTTTATATATTSAVPTSIVVGITAQFGGSVRSTSLTVTTIGLASGTGAFTASPTTITGGSTSTGTVTLFCAPILADITVPLSSDTPDIASVPSSVTVPIGQISASFTITTTAPASTTSVVLSATLNRVATRTVSVTQGVSVANLAWSPSTVLGSASATGTVTLSAAAGAGGTVVSLSSADPSIVSVPSTVTVAEGATAASFVASTVAVVSLVSINVTASLGASQRIKGLSVRPPGVLTHTIAPSTVTSNQTSTGTITLELAAPVGGVVVSLTSLDTTVATPAVASVTVAEGASQATYIVQAQTVTVASTTRIAAQANSTSKLARINVNP